MKKPQPVLGKTGMLFFLVIISAFPPLTIDLYLPALPQMVEVFNTDQSMVNLTLSSYFVTYAVGLLFWGPLSEKFGRKPILLIGIASYMVASVLCAMTNSIEQLIGARIFQAFAGSAITVIATAIVKDLYDGREREKIMATIMSLVIIAPMVAPVFGAFLLKIASWRMMFVTLAVFGAFASVLALCYRETLESKYQGSIFRSWGRLAVVMKNRSFIKLLVIFSITPMALMGFLAAGSYIYINDFGLTEQQFSYAFAFNALCASFGPTLYMKLSYRVSVQKVISACFALLAIAGIFTLTVGGLSPWFFMFIAAPATLMVIIMRVPGTNLMLNQQDQDTGSAVALIQFFSMICGSLGMVLVSIRPDSLIENLGFIQLSVGILGGLMWLMVRNKEYVTKKLN
ncbi:multidrug effflux MFS transporter [Vibrio crassostreae]|uniref:multidrug effflux MFS transporter n=1 Tax=Vibrio crassostreae TaxID=246167 RepID=UPI000FAC155B|nr:DHA1 family bicyclomycin/chloramphenicol resistance-like MFS transporter [Vibrio crassostreae]ROO54914.1 DHA1 family bicyclomycin/chloramphenicol resistance-like MFS transporter [Vibrio crassostreae]ROO69025.1 DHA1 family bicyclomycin/chloramphenicol resistance-like MFS transporter [Vibrio crassostreae]ROO70566.1 DHA1 family bicyclomycin/chloramphenicol resistance-like MFS transporter [Vibrio crassostreae]ROR63575.1 DHA1 family bicyclomycin/chloramphenicol resistance-like MFS transporter [Vi